MDTALRYQLFQLTAAALTGVGLGILYDGAHIFFRRVPIPFSVLTDLLYLLLSGVWAFQLAQETSGGFTVLFLLGCACGIGLYICTLHRPLGKSLRNAERRLAEWTAAGKKYAGKCAKNLKKVRKNMKKYLCK